MSDGVVSASEFDVDPQPERGTKTKQRRLIWSPALIGTLFVVGGLMINPWAMGRSAAVSDSDWDYWPFIGFLAMELLLVLLGLWWLYRRPRLRVSVISAIVLLPYSIATAAGAYGTLNVILPSQEEQKIAKIGRSEKLYLALSSGPGSVLKHTLNKSIGNLRIPDVNSRMIFADTVTVRDLRRISQLSSHETLPRLRFEKAAWPVEGESREVSASEMDLWRPLLDQVEYWKHAKFYIVHSEFLNEDETEYMSEVGFSGLSVLSSGQFAHVHGKVLIDWLQSDPGDASEPGTWRIHKWETVELTVRYSSQLLFTEIAEAVLPDKETCQRTCTSVHEQYVAEYLRTSKKPRPEFQTMSTMKHPGLSVVDIDADGFDDLYVMARWGKNILLRNQRDGTFQDVAAQYGLDIKDHCTSAIFADFDNDGDPDLFLGRTIARSMYLVNENGKFVDRSDSMVSIPLPYFVNSVSAADYNGDGLLDVIFSTGGGKLRIEVRSTKRIAKQALGFGSRQLLERWLPPDQATELFERTASPDFNLTTNRAGPPNVLLRNVGNGKFDFPPEAREVEVWHNTFQTTWADYDGDGDPDLYCANDYAPNNFLRNEGGTFVDVTNETNTADIGFGMGAAFGDYNNDGWLDLYVTNMYSKAGRRIAKQLTNEEKKLKFGTFARGNTLFRHDRGEYKRVSGLQPPSMLVEVAGWGWGGQFVDVDNDGFEDIYALSGNYTPPKELTAAEDT